MATEPFWSLFGEALGMSVDTLDTSRREALAIKAAGLLRQAIEGLQQNLRTRDELNSELNVMWSIAPYKHPNPLSDPVESVTAMPVATEPFWSLFGEALGMSVDTLDTS
ncbi:type VI secretion system-associated FHA domain protein, partial [Corynebacterium diphtheriae]